MIGLLKSTGNTFGRIISLLILVHLLVLSFSIPAHSAEKPGIVRGVYFPSSILYGRSFEGIVHYMEAAGLNLAVLHVKDPMGRLFWKTKNAMAVEMGASTGRGSLEASVRTLKQKGIWTAAKLDVFQDSLLVVNHPELGVANSDTGQLWADKKGLHWANPYDRRVWEYTIALCLELIEIGFDEIQFDYVRFPSDGNMSTIEYPVILEGTRHAECIGQFLAFANSKLKPAGAVISVDLFGLTAWKTGDFGVGQVLDKIAPHVDVLCPMLYPSHFPKNFLSLKNPGQYPYKIYKLSLDEMTKRTDKQIRPWIQGFWYSPEEINAQLQGVADSGTQSWTVWSPSGRYAKTFNALEIRSGNHFPEPELYPSLEGLRYQDDLVIPGRTKVINYTNYEDGYSIISLDESVEGERNAYGTIINVVSTLDEGIMDCILTRREIDISVWTSRHTKATLITRLILRDLGANPRRMRPVPIYIDWNGKNFFTRSIPQQRLSLYKIFNEDLQSVIADAEPSSSQQQR
ncbi:putative glycoside hydrolase [Acidobacteriota bacterium]